MKLSLGLSLGGNQGAGTPPIITATVSPAAQSLTAGDTVGDITNIATLRTTGNYASTAGTISSAVIRVDGTAQANGFTLSAGEVVDVFVTDSAANTRTWTIDASVAAAAGSDSLLLETGDFFLLETGDKLLLEAA